MGAVIGLLLGAGLVLMLVARWAPEKRRRSVMQPHIRKALLQTGITFVAVCAIALAVSQSVPVSFMLAAVVAVIPWSRRNVAARRQRELTLEAWPDIVDDLASGVRAGLPLTDALVSAGARAPEHMRPAFSRFGARLRLTGRVDECLSQLETELEDPIAVRVIDAVRLTREVGGVDMGRVLRTLSAYLREDARLRGEVVARQSLSINAARMAVAAPWLVLGMLALRPTAVAAYSSGVGVAILVAVALLSFVAYQLMLRLGRLPATSEFA